MGRHGSGPYWTLSDADSVSSQHFIPQKTSPIDEPNTIGKLLLMTKQGKTPTGLFDDVNYIHRVATKGGREPYTQPARATETIDVPYMAVYRFSK